jgi:hypothetical protein
MNELLALRPSPREQAKLIKEKTYLRRVLARRSVYSSRQPVEPRSERSRLLLFVWLTTHSAVGVLLAIDHGWRRGHHRRIHFIHT